MKTELIDAVKVWKQFEDLLIPGLRLSVFERALYSHLLRHSRLEGRPRLRFSIKRVARGSGLSEFMVRKGVRQLVAKGAVHLAERSKRGHLIEVRLPEEIRAVREREVATAQGACAEGVANLEEADFLETRARREAIYLREGGHCFYCLRRTTSVTRCIDQVIPRVEMGGNSYRNLVSSCGECNSQKAAQDAQEFLRWLYREGRLGASDLKERLQALERLAAGKMRPEVGEPEQREGGFSRAIALQGAPQRVARGDYRERQEIRAGVLR